MKKKLTALLMSVVMLAGMIVPVNVRVVEAKVGGEDEEEEYFFGAYEDRTLNDDLEDIDKPSGSTDAAIFWSDNRRETVAGYTNGHYEMVYYTVKGGMRQKHILSVTVGEGGQPDQARVQYKIQNMDATGSNIYLRTADQNFRVYLNGDFVNPDYNFGGTQHPNVVLNNQNPPRPLGWNNTNAEGTAGVHFDITRGQGVSFRYNDRNIRFLWNGDAFTFVTDGIMNGDLYLFTLQGGDNRQDAQDNGKMVDLYFCNGLANLTFEPTAYPRPVKNTKWQTIYQDGTVNDSNRYPNPVNPPPETGVYDKIAEEPGVLMSFNMLRIWDNGNDDITDGKFRVLNSTDNIDVTVELFGTAMTEDGLLVNDEFSFALQAVHQAAGGVNTFTGIRGAHRKIVLDGQEKEFNVLEHTNNEKSPVDPRDFTKTSKTTYYRNNPYGENKIAIELLGLYPSMYFSRGRIDIGYPQRSTGDPLLASRFHSIGQSATDEAVYTYLWYQAIIKEDEDYLDIIPYYNEGVGGFYTVYSGQGLLTPGGGANLSQISVTQDREGYGRRISLPIYANDSTTRNYRIGYTVTTPYDYITPYEDSLKSQVLVYKKDDTKRVMSTPRIIISTDEIGRATKGRIVSLFNDISQKYEDYALIDLVWDMGSVQSLSAIQKVQDYASALDDHMTVEYDFKVWLEDGQPPENLATIKIHFPFEDTKILPSSGGGDVTNMNIDIDLIDAPKDRNSKVLRLNDNNSGLYIKDGRLYAYAQVLVAAEDKTHSSMLNDVVYYPNIYNLDTGATMIIPENPTVNDDLRASPVSLTLDGFSNMEVPIPINVRAVKPKGEDPVTEIAYSVNEFIAEWDRMAEEYYQDYVDEMLEPFGYEIFTDANDPPEESSIRYNLYITTDKSKIEKLANEFSGKTTFEYNPAKYGQEQTDFYSAFPNMAIINFKTSMQGDGVSNKINVIDFTSEPLDQIGPTTGIVTTSALDHFRAGEIIKIKDIPEMSPGNDQNIRFKGIDENQVLYFVVETVIEPYDPGYIDPAELDPTNPVLPTSRPAAFVPDDTEVSKMSSVISHTTDIDPEKPGPGDVNPAAPGNFIVYEEGNGFVKLYWDHVDYDRSDESEERIEYQLFKVEGTQANDDDIKARDPFPTFWSHHSNITDDKDGFMTDFTVLSLFNGASFVPLTSTSQYDLDIFTEQDGNIFTDYTLYPNKIYFYYVRAVRLEVTRDAQGNEISAQEAAYSTWQRLSITTDPVKGPINLKQERAYMTYDQKSEVVISFDAPITDLTQLGSAYDLQYQIKEETDDWQSHVTMAAGTLRGNTGEAELEGYTKFYYKITGLNPGKNYTIWVRMVDHTTGDNSLPSNTIVVRIDSDQGSIDEEEDNKKWEDLFVSEAMEIIKRPYWVKNRSGGTFEAVYRAERFPAELAAASSGAYELGPGEDKNQIYFIPSTSLIDANNQNKGLLIKNDEITISLPPRFMDKDVSEAIKDVISQINTKDIEDYYIRINAGYLSREMEIENNTSISPRIELGLQTIGLQIPEAEFDADVVEKFYELIDKDGRIRQDLRNELSRGIKANDSNVELRAIIDKYLERLEDEVSDYVDDHLEDERRYEYDVNYFVTPATITIEVEDMNAINAYEYDNGAWLSKDTQSYGNGAGFQTNRPSMYIFTGRVIIIPGLENMNNANGIYQIVAKYGLDDFFGKGTAFNVNAPITRYNLMGSVARIAGAPNNADYAQWLASQGISFTSANQDGVVQSQEVIYLVMMVYEVKTNNKVETMKINNYNVLSGMQGINSRYQRHLLAAGNLNMLPEGFNPRGEMKVKDFLVILGQLSSMINY